MFRKVVILFAVLFACEMVLAQDYAPKYTNVTFPLEVPKKDHFIMFYTTWCGHSRRLQPTWEELARSINGHDGNRVQIAKVDCDQADDICSQNNIGAYPTLKFFAHGETISRYMGERTLASLTTFVDEHKTSVNELDTTSEK